MVFRVVLAFVLLISATADAKGGVSIWMDEVTLTCPEEGSWFWNNGTNTGMDLTSTYNYQYTGTKDIYFCNHTEAYIYHFYIQGKPCKNCIELDALVFAVVIVADVLVTVLIMAIVYKCSKKKLGGTASNASRSRQENVRLDAVTYEALNQQTRNDEYSIIHRTG